MPVRVAKFTSVDASAKLARAYVGVDPCAAAPLLHVPRRIDRKCAGYHAGFSNGEWRRQLGERLVPCPRVWWGRRTERDCRVFVDGSAPELTAFIAEKLAKSIARTRVGPDLIWVNGDIFDGDAVRNPQPALDIRERFTSRNPLLRRKKIDKMDLDTATMWRAHAIMARAAAETYSRKWIDSKLAALTKRIAYLEGERYGLAYRDAALRSGEPTS